MNEFHYMTPKEQELMEVISGTLMIRTSELHSIIPDMNGTSLRKTISSLAEKGYLYRLRRDLYIVTEDGVLDPDILIKVGPLMYRGYVAFSSALYLHGLLDYHPFTVFVATCDRSASLIFGNYDMRFISLGKRFTGMENKDGIWRSDLEKTLFDCLYKPAFAGGLQNLTKALTQAERIDWSRFELYLWNYGSVPLRQRAGFLLESMARIELLKVPRGLMDRLGKYASTPTRLDPSGPGYGTYSRNWKVLDNLGERSYLGWCESG